MAGEVTAVSPGDTGGGDIKGIVTAFDEDCRMRNMTRESILRYISGIRLLNGFCQKEHYDLIKIEDQQVVHFLKYLREERHNSPKTVKNVFNTLSSFYEFLVYVKILQRNPIPPIRKRYIRSYKSEGTRVEKRLLSVEEMSHLISMAFNVRDRAIMILLAKTGMRRNELVTLDLDDIDIPEGKLVLKPTAKRSNRVLFFDNECAVIMKDWLEVRERMKPETRALFVNSVGKRTYRTDIYEAVTKWAQMAGFHNPKVKRADQHFGPHCFRHWNTTWLLRKGMPREYVKELRGDARRDAIDIYNHIDMVDLKKSYLASIPQLFNTSAID